MKLYSQNKFFVSFNVIRYYHVLESIYDITWLILSLEWQITVHFTLYESDAKKRLFEHVVYIT